VAHCVEEVPNAMLPHASPHIRLAGERQHVGLLARFEDHPQPPAVAVDGVGDDPRRCHTGVQRPLQHLLGEHGFGPHRDVVGDTGLFASRPVVGPLGGQVQLPVEEGVPPPGGVGQKHAHLAVLDPSGRARVLALDAHALRALLEKAGLVDDQHPRVVRQPVDDVGAQIVAHRIGVPGGTPQQVLHAVRRGVPRHFGHLPAVLALGDGKQAPQVVSRPLAHLGAGEARGNPRVHRRQFLAPRRSHLPIHRVCHHLLRPWGDHDATHSRYLQL
jgi:hypothetical protein